MSIQKLAEFIVQTNYEQIPKEAIEIIKDAILDCIGVMLAGSREEGSKILFSIFRELGGQPAAGVIGGGFRTSPVLASLANGTTAHLLDYDDLLERGGHPSAVIVPTILAMGERCKSSGREIVAAYAVGFEIGAKVGFTLGNRHYAKGWHNTSTVGSLRATAAAAKLMGLDVQQTRMALGIAASLAGGLRANFGTMTKPLHAGNAARNGIIAGLLAEKGFTANDSILSDEFGFFEVFGEEPSYNTELMCKQLGSPLAVVSPGIRLKKYPCCAGSHASIDAVLRLKKEHPFNYREIIEVECTTGKSLPKVMIHHRPKTGLEGKFSLEYCIAAALVDGEVTLEHFTDEKVHIPEYQDLILKVKYSHPPEIADKIDHNDLPRTVTIRLANGEVFCSKVNIPKGNPKNPMSEEELHSKFEHCAQSVLPAEETAEVIRLISRVEQMPEISGLMDILWKDKEPVLS